MISANQHFLLCTLKKKIQNITFLEGRDYIWEFMKTSTYLLEGKVMH